MYPLVAARAHHRCEYCHTPQHGTGYQLELDHVVPSSQGGRSHLDNLALACVHCNRTKAARMDAVDPHSGRRVPLFHPRQQRWEDHFRRSATYQSVLGRTDIGRATVAALQMNSRFRRGARVHWRRVDLIP